VTREEALEYNQTAQEVVTRAADRLDTVEQRLVALEATGPSLDPFVDSLRPFLSDEHEATIDEALAAGEDGYGALRGVLDAIAADLAAQLAQLERDREEIEALPPGSDATTQAVTAGFNAAAAALSGHALPAIVVAVAGFFAWLRGRKLYRRQGALEVASSIANGRVADPVFNNLFGDDESPAARAMKARLAESWPEVVKAVADANAAAKTSKAPRVDPFAAAGSN
jgi:hypothetical protein